MITELNKLQQRLSRKLGERDILLEKLSKAKKEKEELEAIIEDTKDAQRIAQLVAESTLANFEHHVSNIVTLALHTVFENPYDFKIRFIKRRNQTECDILFVRNGNEISPINASGVGAVDVAAFALRIALWSLEPEQKRNLFILDEPFKHLRGADNQRRTSAMVRRLSTDLYFQILMVADVNFVIEADKVFNFVLENGISILTEDKD